jgi:hypothetical protein
LIRQERKKLGPYVRKAIVKLGKEKQEPYFKKVIGQVRKKNWGPISEWV